MSEPTQEITPWGNRFETPDLATLLEGVPEESGQAFRAVLDGLLERDGCKSSIEWLGLPWRWAIVISHPAVEHPALAYLVASPEAPLLCVPSATTGNNRPDFEKLTKPVRKAMDAGAIVAGYIWAEWAISDVDLVAIKPLLDARAGS